MTARIGIVGGGIIGCAIACWLLAEGCDVTVFEADIEGLPAAAGSAGLLALREIEPLARPGTLLSVPRWLADPNGPLSLRMPDLPRLVPWLLAFAANARPAQVEAGRAALTTLMRTALEDHRELGRRAGLSSHIRQTGALTLYDTHAGLDAADDEARRVRELLGYESERLSPAAASEKVPALRGAFAGAIHAPEYHMVSHPLTMLRQLQATVRERGTLCAVRAMRVVPDAEGPQILDAAGETRGFDAVVVSAGIWSRDFVRDLGLQVLLETERGYNTTFMDPGFDLPMAVFLGDHGFLASPFDGGVVRIGGGVELASPEAPPSRTRASTMLEKMRRYMPALPREGGVEWMGRRPSTPDSLPVIGPHPGEPRIVYAFGHGHLGLTLSAVTARLVAGMVRGGTSDPAIAPFSIARFQ